MSITGKFLQSLFGGKWSNFAHWALVLIISLLSYIFAPWWIAALAGFFVMAGLELVQYIWCSGWNWDDIYYNFTGMASFLVIIFVEISMGGAIC